MYLSYDQIEAQAEAFLARYNPTRTIPVPIEHIVEIQLRLSVVPVKGLFRNEQIDAYLSHDLTELYIDEDHYMDQTPRSRFTLAHEMGHYEMHRDFISQEVTTIEEWKIKILGEGQGRAYRETQANHFAGCLLLPRTELIAAYEQGKGKAKRIMGSSLPSDKELIPYIANDIAKQFAVSPQTAEIRLNKVI
jgi:Zn-dependent peptidase ImmA (M78 family)